MDGNPTLTNIRRVVSSSRMKWPSILLSSVLVFLAACASQAPPAPKPVENDAASSKHPSMVTQNPDGTFTIQKEPSKKGDAENDKGRKGLVIPPQVVVPEVRPPEKQN